MCWFPVHNTLVATILSCCSCHVVLQTGLRCCKKRRLMLQLLASDYSCLLPLVTEVATYFYLQGRDCWCSYLMQTGLCWCTLLFLQKEAAAPAAGPRQADSSCSNSFIKMQYFLSVFLHFYNIPDYYQRQKEKSATSTSSV